MNPFEIAVPATLDEAVEMLVAKKGRSRIIAGGTDLIPQMKTGVTDPERLVDLKGIPGLDRLEASEKGLRLGTLVSLDEIAAHPDVVARWPALSQGAAAAASPQIRNAGTLGGNLCQRPRCWYFRNEAFHCRKKGGAECFALEGENKYHAIFGDDSCRIVHPSDTAPALVAYEAEATLRSPRGTRSVPLGQFFIMPEKDPTWENVLERDEIVESIFVPAPPSGTRALYMKIRERESFDFALASVAAVLTLDAGTCTRARIVFGGVAPIPWRVMAAESALIGRMVDEALIARVAEVALEAAAPLSKNRYKVALAKGVLRKALSRLVSSG